MAKKVKASDCARMPFSLTPAQLDIRARARAFTTEYIIPAAPVHDESATFPTAVVARARTAGLLNTNIPAEYGGPGFGVLEESIVAEEFGYGCSGIWTSMGINNLAIMPILFGGNGAQRKHWLRRIVDGATPAFGLTEPGGGSDAAGITTVARRDGDRYVLSGAKRYISNSTVADVFVVFAKTDPGAGHRGVSAFLVPAGTQGFTVLGQFEKSGHRAYDTSEIELRDVVVPAADRLGAEGDGFDLALRTFDRNRPVIAAVAVGVARRALEEATGYAAQRRAFGHSIAEFQAVGHKLADIATGIEAARLLTWRAAAEADAGAPNTALASMAKAFATDLAMRATTDAVQIFGAAGIMRHNPVEKLMRDAKVLQVYEGTNEIQRNIIVRELLRPHASALRPSPVPRVEPVRPAWMPAPAVARPATNGNGSGPHRAAVARRPFTAYDILRGTAR